MFYQQLIKRLEETLRQREDLEQVRQELYQEEQAEIIKLKVKVSLGSEGAQGEKTSGVRLQEGGMVKLSHRGDCIVCKQHLSSPA